MTDADCAEAEAPGRAVDWSLEGRLEMLPCAAMIERDGWIIARNRMARRMSGAAAASEAAVETGTVLPGAEFVLNDAYRSRVDCMLMRRYGPAMAVHVAAQPATYRGERCRLVLMLEREHSAAAAGEGLQVEDVLDALPEATAITNRNAVVHVNGEFSRLFGYSPMDAVGRDITDLIIPEGRHHEQELMLHLLHKGERGEMDTIRMTRWGEALDVHVRLVEVRLGGETPGVLTTYRDIRRQKQEEARLTHTARHDGLTGLPNRVQFLERVEMMLSRLRRRPDRRFAVIFLDLDGFKQVNDTLGHAAGDELLIEVAARLTGCLRPQDVVARFGGDEFALLLDENGGMVRVESVAMRIQQEIRRPVQAGGQSGAQVAASMGIVVAEAQYETAEAILLDADRAMYQAKARGKARHVIINTERGRAG